MRKYSQSSDQPELDDPPLQTPSLGLALRERVIRNTRGAAKRLMGEGLLQELQQYRSYEKAERLAYLKMRVMNGFGLTHPRRNRPPATARSFVFVCFGNIMRSPMCEALMNRELFAFPKTRIRVTSAGLNATPGTPAHPWAVSAAREFGISLEDHRARILTGEMIDQADAVLVMDYQNHVQIVSRHEQARNKVFMLSAYAGKDYRPNEIRDPYYLGQEGTVHCYRVLNSCIRRLADSLSESLPSHRESDSTRRETPCE